MGAGDLLGVIKEGSVVIRFVFLGHYSSVCMEGRETGDGEPV